METVEDFRSRTANDRAAALDAKYDPDDDIALRKLGAPIGASDFLTRFLKKGKGMGSSGEDLGGDV